MTARSTLSAALVLLGLAQPVAAQPADSSLPEEALRSAPPASGVRFVPETEPVETWSSSPWGDVVEQNNRITAGYHAIDLVMIEYLETQLPSWTTFGKHASYTAGLQIRDLDELLTRIDQAVAVMKGPPRKLGEEPAIGEAMRLLEPLLQKAGDDTFVKNGLLQFLLVLKEGDWELLDHANTPAGLAIGKARKVRDALVRGNRAIYGNFAPAYVTFLRLAQKSPDGLPPVPLTPASLGEGRDPEGYLSLAFQRYTEARAAASSGSTQRALLHEANLLIGYHEQRLVIQPIFDTIDSELGAALMRLEDPLGTYKLLPHGGNWADLSTRMGMVPAGDGPAPRFALPPLEDGKKLEGTIGEYFTVRIREQSDTRLQLMHEAPARIERLDTLPYPEDIGEALRQTRVRAQRFDAFLRQVGSNLENELEDPGTREFLDRVTGVLE